MNPARPAADPAPAVARVVERAADRLAPVSDSPRLDAELLLAHVLGCDRSGLRIRDRDVVGAQPHERFEALVRRRAEGEPVAYLLGYKEFWSMRLAVTPAVLVPRPETELLVEWGLELLAAKPAPRVLDLGTGSGAIALALARERPGAALIATDRSPRALDVARGNAQALGLRNVAFRHGSWYSAVDAGPSGGPDFDLVVSNPPYVATGDAHLERLRSEPVEALTAGADGLAALREIVDAAPRHLRRGGWLLVEHGAGQGAAVRALLDAAGFAHVRTRQDLAGHDRACAGQKP